MIPPQLMIIAAQYGTKIIIGLALIAALIAGYYYWKHEVASEAHDKAVDECNLSREKFRIDAEHFKLAKQQEVDKLSKEHDERIKNAIEIYVKHYELNRNTPIATSLRVKANCTVGTSSNTMPGTDQGRPQAAGGIGGTGTAELSAGALQQFNKVIDDIERMELKCEQLLNSVQ